jgi:hypothetical protein
MASLKRCRESLIAGIPLAMVTSWQVMQFSEAMLVDDAGMPRHAATSAAIAWDLRRGFNPEVPTMMLTG